MRIGIDIDNTITDVKEKLLKAKVDYANKLNKSLFTLTEEDIKIFLETINEDITFNAQPREDAVKIINTLHSLGHEIYIITARHEKYHSNVYKRTKDWLINNGICFDVLIVNAEYKDIICIQHNIDLMIDDKISICKSVLENGIQVLSIDNDCSNSTNAIPVFQNWKQIFEYIQSSSFIKIIKYEDIYKSEVCAFINECMHMFINRPYKRRADIENINNYYLAKGGIFLLAVDIRDNKIVGSIAFENRKSYGILKRFYVDRDYQHNGIGQRLFACLESFIVQGTSCTEVYLTCGNILHDAHLFYKLNGFELIDKPNIELHYAADDDFFMKNYNSLTSYSCSGGTYNVCFNCSRACSISSTFDENGEKLVSIGCIYKSKNSIFEYATKNRKVLSII